jgi:folate-binding protein YgfZ
VLVTIAARPLPSGSSAPYFCRMADAVVLTDRGIVEVAGAEATSFLQGLVTNDVTRAVPGRAVYAALLTPQGKIIYDFLIAASADGFLIDCAKAHAADLAARLKKYRLRAKVTIQDRSAEFAVVALPEVPPDATVVAFVDPRLAAIGARAIVPVAALESWVRAHALNLRDKGVYDERRITLGVPDAADIPPETYFPLDCNFEELNGVDFDKGCYVGQELTARMKHRATARRRILPVAANTLLPVSGTPVTLNGVEIGELRAVHGSHGLALVRLDRLGEAEEATAGGATIHISKPSYPLILATGT